MFIGSAFNISHSVILFLTIYLNKIACLFTFKTARRYIKSNR